MSGQGIEPWTRRLRVLDLPRRAKDNGSMKRFLTVLALWAVLVFALWANQTTYAQNSPEVQLYLALRAMAGTSGLDPMYPVTGDQLLNLLSKVDTGRLDSDAQALYSGLVAALEGTGRDFSYDEIGIDLSVYAGGQGYANSYPTGNPGRWDYAWPLKDRLPVYGVRSQVYFGESFTAMFQLDRMENDSYEFRNKNLALSHPFVGDKEVHSPYFTYGSLGGKILNLQIGRDKLSMGNGSSGNLGISDNLISQDYLKFSAITYPIAYDMTFIAFGVNRGDDPQEVGDYSFKMPEQMVVNHRLSLAVTSFLTVSIYEGMLQYGTSVLTDPRTLSPFMILHNLFTFDNNCNNYFGGDVTVATGGGIQLSLQFLLDQFQFTGEIGDHPETSPPNAYGMLAGVSGHWMAGGGVLGAYMEGIYTSPVCYLKEIHGRSGEDTEHYYDQDFLVGNPYWNISDMAWMGHEIGPDSVALQLGASYCAADWTIGFWGRYRATGSYNAWNQQYLLLGQDIFDSSSPTYQEDCAAYLNALSPFCLGDDVPEHRLTLSLEGSAKVFDAVDLVAKVRWQHAWNYRNSQGAVFDSLQATIGFTVDVFRLAYDRLAD